MFDILLNHNTLVLFGIIFFGIALGSIKIYGLNLGLSGVLFVALAAGHYRLAIPNGVGQLGLDGGPVKAQVLVQYGAGRGPKAVAGDVFFGAVAHAPQGGVDGVLAQAVNGSVLLTDFIATVLVTNSILSFKFPNMWAG